MMKTLTYPPVEPLDQYNRQLLDHVHPADWVNPEPNGPYHLVVIGAGTAGLVTAAGAAGLGARVALIERTLFGGDCLNWGCVPSKSIIRSARAVADVRDAPDFGVEIAGSINVDFARVMERMRAVRAHISRNDSVHRFKDLGVDVYLGSARFMNRHQVEVDGRVLTFKKAVIATGARAVHPPIPGLKEAGYLTNETVFNLTERPDRLVVIGAGPIGCELSQTFQRLGSQVYLIEMADQLLTREDRDAVEILQRSLARDGVQLMLKTTVQRVEVRDGTKIVHVIQDGQEHEIPCDAILVGVGRAPNIDGLNLEAAGVEYNRYGVIVNEYLQTSNPKIYAAGDICLPHKFTHTADASARIVIRNALFPGRQKWTTHAIPWCTYTDPEIAHVGLNEQMAAKEGIPIDTFKVEFSDVDRALADGEEEGFVKIHVRKGTDKIVGGTIVARHAGEMINEITLAIVKGIGLGELSNVIHPYPTQAEAIRKAADAYNRTKLTPRTKKILSFWFRWFI